MTAFAHPPLRQASHAVSAEEWAVRVDLAAFYRLAALYGWDDLIATHISARVPGPAHHFLINPFGLMFDEVTASSLVKVDLDGRLVGENAYGINYAGFVIHSAIHAARPDALFIAHFHSPDGMAVSAHAEGLLPLNQRALTVIPSLSYHDYEGIALELDERERLVADLGETNFMLLRNHGTLALGRTAGAAWGRIYQLESACTAQVRTLSIGRENVLIAPKEAQDAVRRQVGRKRLPVEGGRDIHELIWEASLRKAARLSPGFDA
ncbi:ribulose-5-phosphate 4-epimerase [Gluconacetobacter johannae DSM 13595]|uniref:Class II aldolase/adducin family protein n=1 Tax=Gluconacetobacter johannae TaxID=112140 RepID=A0A7W4J5N9_9PROT|nr:class II aldolase/adducin family protein [Gluconacetobacter johannae]MBB2174902.1 class II aldolase/adducin family protein [Gluconacetobacter johannae]GBQ87711.1 ribulose-5-phosphate 4-epimerase [Gluconacetobacter johannae DSM 13595]